MTTKLAHNLPNMMPKLAIKKNLHDRGVSHICIGEIMSPWS